MRWRNYKLLTGDPGYPDYPIPIPPNETLSEEVNLGWVKISSNFSVANDAGNFDGSKHSTINVVSFLTLSRSGTRAETLSDPYPTNSFDITCSTVRSRSRSN